MTVKEGKISIHEVIEADKEGRLVEMFGASTHCPLMPIKRVCYRDTTMNLGQHAKKDSFSRDLNDYLVNMLMGDADHPWITSFE